MSEQCKGVLLVVDDEPLKRVTLQIELTEAGYQVHEASDARAAVRLLAARSVDVVITDVRMPEIDGFQFLETIKGQSPDTQVLLMTAFGSVDAAVQAIKRGAYDYLTKPFNTDVLLEKLDRLFACRSAKNKTNGSRVGTLGAMVGQSYAARRLFEQIRNVADSDHAVLIQGESGSGRQCVADAIHQLSRRSDRPLVKQSCAGGADAVSREFFGRGAGSPSRGQLELADGGTVYLGEIDALPLELQAKLLQVLEHKRIQRGDAAEGVAVDVRLICATDRDLRQCVAERTFREDLYYHLEAVHILVPPLRDRREDIPVLAEHFLQRRAGQQGDGQGMPRRFASIALDALMGYHWPGNVREFEHVIERALASARGEEIQPSDILLPLPAGTRGAGTEASPAPEGPAGLTDTVAGVERTLIDAALRKAAGNQAKAAQFLGIPRTTLRDKMAKYGMVTKSAQRPDDD
jgi:DNA-binding NtrC family response regulator